MKNLNFLKNTWGLLLLIAFSSCGSLKYYDSALSDFNRAAELETKNKVTELESPNLVSLQELYPSTKASASKDTSIVKMYQEASTNIGKALSTPSKLKNAGFNLMGNAFCLQSLTAWKLGKPQEALTKREVALNELENSDKAAPTDERDLIMMTALPGLVDLEMAYDSMEVLKMNLSKKIQTSQNAPAATKQAIFDKAQAHYRQFMTSDDAESGVLLKALILLEECKNKASTKHPVKSYLLLSQLTGLNTWAIELSEIDNAARVLGLRTTGSPTQIWLNEQRTGYKSIREIYLLELEKLLPKGKADSDYIFWKRRL